MSTSRLNISFLVYFSCFFVCATFFLCVARSLLDTTVPTPNLSEVIPMYREEMRPEKEIMVYIIGISGTLFCSLVYYVLFLQRQHVDSLKRVYLLFSSFVLLPIGTYYYLWISKSISLSYLMLCNVIFVSFILSVCFILSDHAIRFLSSVVSRLFLLVLLVVNVLVFSFLFLTKQFVTHTLFPYVQTQSYQYASPDWYVYPLFLVGTCSFFIFIIKDRIRMRIKRNMYPIVGTIFDLLVYSVICFSMLLVVFAPENLSTLIFPNYNPVVGPIHDVLGGKTLLVNVHSQYGLLMVYVLALLFKIIPLTYTSFYWVNMGSLLFGYVFLYSATKILLGRVAGIFALITVFLHVHFTYPYDLVLFSQSTFLRWGGWIVLLWFLVIRHHTKKSFFEKIPFVSGLEYILVGVCAFWGFDVGVYTLLAYCSFRVAQEYIHHGFSISLYKDWSVFFLKITGTLLFFFIGISAFTFFRSGILPDWHEYVNTTVLYANGAYMFPMESFGIHVGIIGGYAVCGAFLLFMLSEYTQVSRVVSGHYLPYVVFIYTFGVCQFMYYVGRSMSGSLHIVLIPFILLFFWVAINIQQLITKDTGIFARNRYVFSLSILLLSMIYGMTMMVGVAQVKGVFDRRAYPFPSFDSLANEEPYRQSISAMLQEVGDAKIPDRRIALISQWDGFFLLHTNTVNSISSNNSDYFQLIPQLDHLIEELFVSDPNIVFVDHDVYTDHIRYLKERIAERYVFSERVGFLDTWEKQRR